jgi:DnaK suppressor protein
VSKTTVQPGKAGVQAAKKAPAAKVASKAGAPAPKSSPKPAAPAAGTLRPTKTSTVSATPALTSRVPDKAPAQVSAKVAVNAPVPAPKPAAAPSAKAARSAAKAAEVLAASTVPAAPPASNRFADRFAPPKPPTRQMNQISDDIVKAPHKVDPKLANAWKTKAGRELTEPELMSMPDSEYMNDKQLDFFRARLQALKDDLLSNAGETTEHLREDTSIVPDPADRATIEEEHALELRTRDRERKLLKKISQSLARLESGEYGFCDETGEPIGLGRLIARPTATLSLEAQQRRELKQKMFGD